MQRLRQLARSLRYYEKKRGDRRTGSEKLGSAGLLFFFAGLFFLGWLFLAVIFTMLAAPEWRANRRFTQTQCQVLKCRVGVSHRRAAPTYRPEIHIRYTVDQHEYQRWTYDITYAFSTSRERCENAIRQFTPGQTYPCWYDPKHPATVVLVRRYTSFVWLLLLLPAGLIAVGLAGLSWNVMNWGASPERRAAMAKRAADMAAPAARAGFQNDYPTIPADSLLTDSPGTTLLYRLPLSNGGGRALVAIVLGCLLFNAMVAVFATLAVISFLEGEPEWLLSAVTLLFLGIGGWLLTVCVRRLARAASVGRTLVEISDHPWRPGEAYQVLLDQFGRVTLRSLRMTLVCDEVATCQQGTNTHTESRRVFEQEILFERNVTIQPGLPYEVENDVGLPSGAMHSFRSPHNEINWKIVVEGRPQGWPGFERSFPLIVQPLRQPRM